MLGSGGASSSGGAMDADRSRDSGSGDSGWQLPDEEGIELADGGVALWRANIVTQ